MRVLIVLSLPVPVIVHILDALHLTKAGSICNALNFTVNRLYMTLS